MGEITNTSKNEMHMEWCMGGNPGAIEAQEKRGQGELVNSSKLPSKVVGKEELEAMGVVFGEPLADGPLFCEASLPDGWEKRATEHSMWSELFDSLGNKVASIFYKAAFYDRGAHMHVHVKEADHDETNAG